MLSLGIVDPAQPTVQRTYVLASVAVAPAIALASMPSRQHPLAVGVTCRG